MVRYEGCGIVKRGTMCKNYFIGLFGVRGLATLLFHIPFINLTCFFHDLTLQILTDQYRHFGSKLIYPFHRTWTGVLRLGEGGVGLHLFWIFEVTGTLEQFFGLFVILSLQIGLTLSCYGDW